MTTIKPYDLSPTEFEEYCENIFKGYGEKDHLRNFEIKHDVEITTHDGIYQIDLYAVYTALGETEFKILCECKKYKSKIKRDVVVALHGKVQSIGAQKGILISTSAFQKGAVQYAKEHGIELIQMTERGPVTYARLRPIPKEKDPYLYLEKLLPPYEAILVTRDTADTVVYPTKSMTDKIFAAVKKVGEESTSFSFQGWKP